MKCAYCGKEFETTDKRVHYCSEECRRNAQLERLRKHNKNSRMKNPEYLKKTYAQNRRRYHARKHERFVELAKELAKHKSLDAKVSFLEDNFRLRH